jgi:hypothetical protein
MRLTLEGADFGNWIRDLARNGAASRRDHHKLKAQSGTHPTHAGHGHLPGAYADLPQRAVDGFTFPFL